MPGTRVRVQRRRRLRATHIVLSLVKSTSGRAVRRPVPGSLLRTSRRGEPRRGATCTGDNGWLRTRARPRVELLTGGTPDAARRLRLRVRNRMPARREHAPVARSDIGIRNRSAFGSAFRPATVRFRIPSSSVATSFVVGTAPETRPDSAANRPGGRPIDDCPVPVYARRIPDRHPRSGSDSARTPIPRPAASTCR